jgi:plastocyanin
MKKILLLSVFFVLSFVATAHAAEVSIDQNNQQFSEDAVKIKTGDVIVFKNNDTVTHNIQVVNADGDTDDKGLAKPGEVLKETFTKAGEYKIRCGIHPNMKVKVSVE